MSEISTSHPHLATTSTSDNHFQLQQSQPNYLQHCLVKIEPPSPKQRNTSSSSFASSSSSFDQHHHQLVQQQHHTNSETLLTSINMDNNHQQHQHHHHQQMTSSVSASASASGVIPVGIAVARQRPQDHAIQPQMSTTQQQQSTVNSCSSMSSTKDQMNRFGALQSTTTDFGESLSLWHDLAYNGEHTFSL